MRHKIGCTAGTRPWAGVALVAVLAAGAVGVAEAAPCIRLADEPVLNTRVMQTELMVAALSCDQRESYNQMVRRFEPELVEKGRSLKRLFEKVYGRGAHNQLNKYVTQLANEASQRSASEGRGFCAAMATIFERIQEMDGAQFADYAGGADFSGRHRLTVCGPGPGTTTASRR